MSTQKKQVASLSPAYNKFQKELYQALEVLLNKTQDEINDQLRFAFTRTLEIIAARYARSIALPELASLSQQVFIQAIDDALNPVYEYTAQRIFAATVKLSQNSQVLSYVGTAEAIGRALQKTAQYNVPSDVIKAQSLKGIDDENIYARIVLSLSRIRRKLIDAVQYSLVTGESVDEMLQRAFDALPKARQVKRPKRVLRKLSVKEADQKPRVDFAMGFISDEDWNALVTDYLEEFIPKHRGPEVELDLKAEWTGKELRYGWEYEQYLTEDFVRKVRGGNEKAAKENGVTDFQWIAVIDEKTDECCAWRDGLTSKEIEDKLKTSHKDDECRAIVPPAHFNCRCDMAPMLIDMPDAPISNAKDFEEWLES